MTRELAGFFGLFDYSKTGPGVKKDAPQKNPFIVFFEVLFAKFWKLILVNLIFVAALVPVMILCGLLFVLMTQLKLLNSATMVLVFLPLCLMGPVIAGMTRLTRDFVRGEPLFLWSDFITTVKKNWKNSLIFSLLSYLFIALMTIALPFYFASAQAKGAAGVISYIPLGLCLFAVLIFSFMQFYIYLMQVTLNLKFKQLLKNAAILSIAALFKNLLAGVVIVLLTGGMLVLGFFSLQTPILMPIFIILLAALYFALVSYISNFIAFPVIKKFIIDPYYEAHPEQTSEGLDEEKDAETETERELPEYVYENGRMVHRSVLEKQSLFDDSQILPGNDEE